MMENVCDDCVHAVFALEFGSLNALEALCVGLLAEDLLFIGKHVFSFDEMEK